MQKCQPAVLQGPGSLTYNITPAADDDGFVTFGAKVALSAIPSPGGILRRIETLIDGESQPVDPTRPPATSLTITGETILTAIFETNPYLLIGGRNKVAGGLLSPETADNTIFDGIFPLSAMQVAVTPSGGLSGKLLVGRNTYSFSGRFDGDGIYSTTLTGYIPCLDWNPQIWNPQNPAVRPTTLPKVRQLPISIRLWVDTANGPETPVLRTFLAESHGVSLAGTLTPQADADYTGKTLFTGSFGKSNNLQSSYPATWSTPQDGAPEGGYFSISARKSGSVVAMGALPNGEKFTSSTRLTNRNGGHSDLEFLAPTGANGVFAFFTTLPQPEGIPLINGYFARREAWYSSARGPVFVSEAKQSTPVFAAEWTPTGAAFTLATAGQTLVPFATQSGARTIPLSLQPTGSSTVQKAFSVQSVNRNSVSVVPDSVQPGFSSAALSLSLGSGLLSGSVLVTNGKIRKRITLQGVLLQGASSGWLGGGVTSDGQQFVLGEPTPVTPEGMYFIPAGPFQMGNNSYSETDGPEHTVDVSAFYMAQTEITYGEWRAVKEWADRNNYAFDNGGSGDGDDYPVAKVSWYDVVKWSNAKSERGSVFSRGYNSPYFINDEYDDYGGFRLVRRAAP